jgi:putative endonuclease
MSKYLLETGNKGEIIAADFLKQNGYKIIQFNFRNKLGQIDIIAKNNDVLCFIEVKTRRSFRFGRPPEAVSKVKQKRIAKSALVYLKNNQLMKSRARFDVVSVSLSNQNPQVDLIKDAFNLEARYAY